MRRPIASCACVLALITGTWFGQAYSLFAPIEPVETTDAAATSAVSTVWRFYDAIDLLLRTADESALLDVIAPDFVDHVDEPGAPSDRDGLVRYLASLRGTHPTLRLTPQDVVAQEDRVVARLAPTGAAGAILGVPLAGKDPWPRVDMVRVQGDRIVERWGDPAGYAPATTLVSETLTSAHRGDLIPILLRVTVAPGASDVSFNWLGPAIIAIESGELEVTAARRATSTSTPELASLQPQTIAAGDSFPVAEGFAFTFANRTASPTISLIIALVGPRTPYVFIPEGAGPSPEGITVRVLAGYLAVTINPGRLAIELARVTLVPGTQLGPHPVTELEIVFVDAGTLTATIDGSPTSVWLRDRQGYAVRAERSSQLPQGYSQTATLGATGYANETAQPATVLLLSITTG